MTETGNIGNPGSINDDETNHLGYVEPGLDGAYDNQILRYDHGISDIEFALSFEVDDDTSVTDTGRFNQQSGEYEATSNNTGTRPQGGDGKSGKMVMGFGARYALEIPRGSLGVGGGFQMGQSFLPADLQRAAQDVAQDVVQPLQLDFSGFAAVPGVNGHVWLPAEEYFDVSEFGVSVVYTTDIGVSAGFQYSSLTIEPGDAPATFVTPVAAASRALLIKDKTVVTQFGIGGGYATGPWSAHANWGRISNNSDSADIATRVETTTGLGLAGGYSLGGGASVKVGYSRSTTNLTSRYGSSDSSGSFSIGLSMSF